MAQPRCIFHSQVPKRTVYNNSGSAIGANRAVMSDSAGVDYVKLPTSAAVQIQGFTDAHGIPAHSWGQIIVEAGCTIPAVNAGGVTQGDKLGVDTNGAVVVLGTTSGNVYALVGTCNVTAADGVVDEIIFDGPGHLTQAQ